MDSEDYRASHQTRGPKYDSAIVSTPFDAYMDKWEGHHLARIVPQLFPDGIPRYLDFACGTGRITQRVESFATESYGVDVSESMLDAARAKCRKTRFVCVDLTRDDADLGQFDLVTSFRFFGNAQDELRESVLAALTRLLKQGGRLIINNHRNPRALMLAARRMTTGIDEVDLSHPKLEALLRKHGFEIELRRPIGFWIFRAKLTTARRLESALADRLERMFAYSRLAAYAPDALLVARKVA